VRGYLALEQGYGLTSALLAQEVLQQTASIALIHGRAILQVGQRESALSVTAIKGAKQGKQRGVLRDGQKLSVTKRPSAGSKVSTKHFDFGNERARHNLLLLQFSK
jgi:hypothetical protein